MFDPPILSRLPADVAEALGRHYLALGRQLLNRAGNARRAQAERARLRDRLREHDSIRPAALALCAAGGTLEAAFAQLADRLDLTIDQVRAAFAAADRRHQREQRQLRNLQIARRAAAGEPDHAIADALGLHRKTVGRLRRALAKAGKGAQRAAVWLLAMIEAAGDQIF